MTPPRFLAVKWTQADCKIVAGLIEDRVPRGFFGEKWVVYDPYRGKHEHAWS